MPSVTPNLPDILAPGAGTTQAQLAGTIHCDYPSWVEFLCFDINGVLLGQPPILGRSASCCLAPAR